MYNNDGVKFIDLYTIVEDINTKEKKKSWVEGYLFDNGFSENRKMFVGGIVVEKYNGNADDEWDVIGIDFCEVDPSTICQYTGFTDRNGDKIWENDVLHVVEQMSNLVYQGTNLISHPHWVNKSNFKVDFTPGGLMNTQRFSNCSSIECEVIGNVFDNPELLEKIGDVHNV